MSENSKTEAQKLVAPSAASAAEAGLARRKLIRAGLGLAPVMMGLKSESAMATGTGNHVTMSAWNSLKLAKGCMSKGGGHQGGTCKSHKHWATVNVYPKCGGKTSVPHGETNFHFVSTKRCPPFDGSTHSGKTLKMVLNGFTTTSSTTYSEPLNETDKLARHCTAMYLNYSESGANSPITDVTCREIWAACKGGGFWNPTNGGTWSSTTNSGIKWSAKNCNDYFDYLCGIPNVNNPTSSSGQTCVPYL